MNKRKMNKKMQLVIDMVEEQYPNVSTSMKQSLAKEYYEKLSDAAFSEMENKMYADD